MAWSELLNNFGGKVACIIGIDTNWIIQSSFGQVKNALGLCNMKHDKLLLKKKF